MTPESAMTLEAEPNLRGTYTESVQKSIQIWS